MCTYNERNGVRAADADRGSVDAIRAETLRAGRVSSIVGIIAMIVFHLQDTTVLGFDNLLAWRAVSLVAFGLFLVLSYTLLLRRPELIVGFHALSLTALMTTVCGIVFTVMSRSDANLWYLSNGANAITVNIVAAFVFAAGVRRYLSLVILGPLALMSAAFLWHGTIDATGWATLSNPGILAVAVVIYASFEARFRREAYGARRLAAEQRETISAQHAMMSTLLDAIEEAAFLMRPDGTIEYGNAVTAHRLGVRWQELVGKNAFDLLPPEVAIGRRQRIAEVLETGEAVRFTDERAGRAIENAIYPVRDHRGTIVLLVIIGFDITARVLAERRVHSLYEEKTLLLKEVHHRIKNNMSTLASMLSLGAAQATAPESEALLDEMRGRISTMMEIYDMLYRTEDYSYVDLRAYIGSLVRKISAASVLGDAVRFETQVAEIDVDRRLIFGMGLVVNELVTNALKYAFPAGRSGTITVRVVRLSGAGRDGGEVGEVGEAGVVGEVGQGRDQIRLEVADDGVGMAVAGQSQDVEIADASQFGFGLRLVEVLVGQLKGTRTIASGRGGTTVTITVSV